MCGIFGTTKFYEADILKKKVSITQHRGPDNFGFLEERGVYLGHNRLSIIDLDARANQPFHFKHLRIVFNGEIYNYKTLKRDLEALGFSFTTDSDTEVICAAYLAYGNDCVKKFNGMFSFVILNTNTNQLFGARDRLGQKPLYYLHKPGHFEFASQLKQIKIGNTFSLNEKAQKLYLSYKYIPEPLSIYKEVNKLKAGHLFTYHIAEDKLNISKYWELPPSSNDFQNYNQASEELEYLIDDAVRLRLYSDVPLGVFLSGGIDSSLISCYAKKHTDKLKTFSIKFEQEKYDESPYAQAVAELLETDHTTINCNYNEGIELIESFPKYFDEPFADASALPTMLLSKHTKQHVTVALSGDAGDELFIGYNRYDKVKKYKALFSLPYPLRKLASKSLGLIPNKQLKIKSAVLSLKDIETFYLRAVSSYDVSWLAKGTNGGFSHLDLLYSNDSLLNRVSAFDLKTYLSDDINVKTDRASMAFSLETRAPLMDYRIVEFSRSIPESYKYHKSVKKKILTDLLYRKLPKSLFDRPKSGFSMPFEYWFRNELKDLVMDKLSPSRLNQINGINPKIVSEMIKEHMEGKRNRYALIWKLLVFIQWADNQ